MTHELGINKDTFSKYLNELKTSGYIKVYKNKTREGRMQNNIYEVVFDRSYIESHISIRCKKENKKNHVRKKQTWNHVRIYRTWFNRTWKSRTL